MALRGTVEDQDRRIGITVSSDKPRLASHISSAITKSSKEKKNVHAMTQV